MHEPWELQPLVAAKHVLLLEWQTGSVVLTGVVVLSGRGAEAEEVDLEAEEDTALGRLDRGSSSRSWRRVSREGMSYVPNVVRLGLAKCGLGTMTTAV